MNWLYRPLLFLGIALLFTAAFVGLSQAGAFKSYEATSLSDGGPPGQTQTAVNSTGSSSPSQAGQENSAAPSRTTTTQTAPAPGPTASGTSSSEFRSRPPGRSKGGFNWQELRKDALLILGAWLAMVAFDRFMLRNRHSSRPAQG